MSHVNEPPHPIQAQLVVYLLLILSVGSAIYSVQFVFAKPAVVTPSLQAPNILLPTPVIESSDEIEFSTNSGITIITQSSTPSSESSFTK